MSSLKKFVLAATAAMLTVAGMAQSLPAGAPAGSTVQCKDGSFASPDTKSGACSGHKGVKTWYGNAQSKVPSVETQSAAVSSTNVAPATGAPTKAPAKPDSASMPAAAGGGAGKVWVNDASKVYHCEGDRYYGKTKKGEYMSEQDAKAHGARPAHKKTCSA